MSREYRELLVKAAPRGELEEKGRGLMPSVRSGGSARMLHRTAKLRARLDGRDPSGAKLRGGKKKRFDALGKLNGYLAGRNYGNGARFGNRLGTRVGKYGRR